jgi:hypothetical protein
MQNIPVFQAAAARLSAMGEQATRVLAALPVTHHAYLPCGVPVAVELVGTEVQTICVKGTDWDISEELSNGAFDAIAAHLGLSGLTLRPTEEEIERERAEREREAREDAERERGWFPKGWAA